LGVHVGDAILDITTTGLGEESHAAVAAEIVGEWLEGTGDVVGDTVGVGTGVVRVEIFVDIEDQVGLAAVWVGDGAKSIGGTRGNESSSRSITGTW